MVDNKVQVVKPQPAAQGAAKALQDQLIKKLEQDTGLSFKGGQLAKLAKLLGFKNVEQLHDYFYKVLPAKHGVPTAKANAYGAKLAKAFGQMFQTSKAKGGKGLLGVIAGLGKTKAGHPRFGFVLKEVQGKQKFYGIEVVTAGGENVALKGNEFAKFKAKFNPDGTLKKGQTLTAKEAKVYGVLKKEGVAALMGEIDGIAVAVGGYHPPETTLPNGNGTSSGQDALAALGAMNNGAKIQIATEAMQIVMDGLKELRESIQAYVEAEIAETERIMKLVEQALKEAKGKEVAKLKEQLKVLQDKKMKLENIKKATGELKAAIASGDLSKIRAALDKLNTLVTAYNKDFGSQAKSASGEKLNILEKGIASLSSLQNQLKVIDKLIKLLESGNKDAASLQKELRGLVSELTSYMGGRAKEGGLSAAEDKVFAEIKRVLFRMDIRLEASEAGKRLQDDLGSPARTKTIFE